MNIKRGDAWFASFPLELYKKGTDKFCAFFK